MPLRPVSELGLVELTDVAPRQDHEPPAPVIPVKRSARPRARPTNGEVRGKTAASSGNRKPSGPPAGSADASDRARPSRPKKSSRPPERRVPATTAQRDPARAPRTRATTDKSPNHRRGNGAQPGGGAPKRARAGADSGSAATRTHASTRTGRKVSATGSARASARPRRPTTPTRTNAGTPRRGRTRVADHRNEQSKKSRATKFGISALAAATAIGGAILLGRNTLDL